MRRRRMTRKVEEEGGASADPRSVPEAKSYLGPTTSSGPQSHLAGTFLKPPLAGTHFGARGVEKPAIDLEEGCGAPSAPRENSERRPGGAIFQILWAQQQLPQKKLQRDSDRPPDWQFGGLLELTPASV